MRARAAKVIADVVLACGRVRVIRLAVGRGNSDADTERAYSVGIFCAIGTTRASGSGRRGDRSELVQEDRS